MWAAEKADGGPDERRQSEDVTLCSELKPKIERVHEASLKRKSGIIENEKRLYIPNPELPDKGNYNKKIALGK